MKLQELNNNDRILFDNIINDILGLNIDFFNINFTEININYDFIDNDKITEIINILIMQYDFRLMYIHETEKTVCFKDRNNYNIMVRFTPYIPLKEWNYGRYSNILQEIAYCYNSKYEIEKRKES